ncbi:MAG: hypothetical protein AB8B63_16095 [Granulosicoccus sp.]
MNDNNTLSFFALRNRWIAIFVLILSAAVVPVVTYSLVEHPPEYDELLHVLAARGIEKTGEPVIEDGRYARAEIYTRLVSLTAGLHEDELIAARLPAIFFTILLAGLIGYWLTRNVGWLAGLVAALVLVIAPATINLAVIVRFYTFHALAVTLLIILLYEASKPDRGAGFRLLVAAFSVALGWLAFQLHDITMITIGATAAGLTYLTLYRFRRVYLPTVTKYPVLTTIFVLLAFVVFVAGAWASGLIGLLRQSAPVWSQPLANYPGFYLARLGSQMPFIWPLFPVMAVAAFFHNRRLAGYLLSIIVVAFVANSIAAQKATRYIYHIFPLICIVWGIGFQALILAISNYFSQKYRLISTISTSLILVLAFTCVLSTMEFRRMVKLVLGRPLINDAVHLGEEPDWIAAKSVIDPLLPDIDRVIASSGFKSLHAFGRYSYELHTTVIAETDTGDEFGVDGRTGKQVISSADSVSHVIEMPGNELFVLEERMINEPHGANSQVMEVIENRCSILPLPSVIGVKAWQC